MAGGQGPARDKSGAITTQVIRSALSVAAAEAGIVVVKAAYSSFIQEGADAAAALLGADGRLVVQSQGTTIMHAASLRACLPALLEDVSLADMAPGDVYVMNDQFRGGIHANDLVIFRPVFAPEPAVESGDGPAGARPVLWFAGTLIHVADVGGRRGRRRGRDGHRHVRRGADGAARRLLYEARAEVADGVADHRGQQPHARQGSR